MRLKLILIVLLTAALFPAAAQSQLPETPAARQFSGWLAAFNSGDRETMLKFLQGNFPGRVAQIDQMMRFQGQVGGFDFKKVAVYDACYLSLTQARRLPLATEDGK